MKNFPSEPIQLNTEEVSDLAHAGYLPHVLPEDIQPALRTKNLEGETLLLSLTKQGVSFDKYPNGTLKLQDLLTKNRDGLRPIDAALNAAKTTEAAIQTLHTALMALSLQDAERLLEEAKTNGLGRFKFQAENPKKQKAIPTGIEH